MTTISTTARPAYVYDESEDTWYPVGAQAIAFVTTYVYTATASQTVFSGADDNSQTLSYTTGAVKVFLNGALLTPTLDYSAPNGTSVTLASGASLDDVLVIVAADTYQDADTYTQAQADLLFVSKDIAGIAQASNYDIGLTTLASDSIALNFSGETGLYTRTAAGNITFTGSNYRIGSIKTVRVIPGASSRNLTFPASWVFVGVKPTSVAANKTGILTVTSFGTTEGDCVAAWAVQL
jgi:hypothetical protein